MIAQNSRLTKLSALAIEKPDFRNYLDYPKKQKKLY